MDIMLPPIDEQPAPAPWLVHLQHVDVNRIIREAVARNPAAGPDEINEELQKREVALPGTLVAEWIKTCKP